LWESAAPFFNIKLQRQNATSQKVPGKQRVIFGSSEKFFAGSPWKNISSAGRKLVSRVALTSAELEFVAASLPLKLTTSMQHDEKR
jgi:low temperature requirement protein LtrA